jgi:hypothetical protein
MALATRFRSEVRRDVVRFVDSYVEACVVLAPLPVALLVTATLPIT